MKKILLTYLCIFSVLLFVISCTPPTLPKVENNTINDATIVSVSGTKTYDTLNEDDTYDFFKFSAQMGYNYIIEVKTENEVVDTTLYIMDDNQKEVLKERETGRQSPSRMALAAEKSAFYYVRVKGNTLYTPITSDVSYYISVTKVNAEDVILPKPQKEWTIMIYMDGDNDLSPFSVMDVNEIIAAGGSDENINIVPLWDQKKSYLSGDRHGYYYITDEYEVLCHDTGEINMGDTVTAKNYIDYVLANFPAKKYMFVFWNHGFGVDTHQVRSSIKKSIAIDFTNDYDELTEPEQFEIIQYFYDNAGQKLDIVAYDACNMQAFEIMYGYRDLVNYMIASTDEEPLEGWDYSYVEKLKANPTMESVELGSNIIDAYTNFYDVNTTNLPITISLADLTEVNATASLLNTFATAAMNDIINDTSYGDLIKNRYYSHINNTQHYDSIGWDLYHFMESIANDPGIVDSDNITIQLSSLAKSTATAILDQIDNKLLIKRYNDPKFDGDAHGLTIFLRTPGDAYDLLDISKDTAWDDFIKVSN